jgi:carboxylesterase type B
MRGSIIGSIGLAALANAQGAFKVGTTIKTTSGDVTGQASKWKPEVSEYLGIPFALPPVGDLRWAAPKAFKNEGKPIEATKYASAVLFDPYLHTD